MKKNSLQRKRKRNELNNNSVARFIKQIKFTNNFYNKVQNKKKIVIINEFNHYLAYFNCENFCLLRRKIRKKN